MFTMGLLSEERGLDEPDFPVQSVSDTRDPETWPLALGETLVVYHPHARILPRVVSTRELAAVRRSPEGLGDRLPSGSDRSDPRPPYSPFKTLADFEQTELFVRRDHTDGEIDDQLNLWQRHVAQGTGVTLKNAREMHRCLQAAGTEGDLSQVSLFSYVSCILAPS